MLTERTIPADIDAERATLGALLLNRDAITAVAPWLAVSAFYLERHAWIYTACLDLYDRNEPPDLRLIASELTRRDRLDAIGGISYLVDLFDSVPTSYHVEYYARLVAAAAHKRGLIQAGGTIAGLGYGELDADAAQALAQAELDALAGRTSADDGLLPISITASARYDLVTQAIERGEPVMRGLKTGWRDLDELTGGLQATDLILLGARPSVGKSSWALCLAYHAAMQGQRGGLFSLEMSREQCVDRLIAIDTGLNTQQVRLGRHWRADELTIYTEAIQLIDTLPLAIDDRAALSVADIRSRALRYAAKHGALDFLIVDYIQLMGSVRRADNRNEEVGEVSRGLKQLAKELRCPIVALSQLSRAVEGRSSHVPMLSDLRDSGSLEQDADVVLFLYREELYDKETDKKGIAELIVAKHRHGPVGVIPMRFDANTTRFLDLTYRSPEGY